jgi:hypothetical protein
MRRCGIKDAEMAHRANSVPVFAFVLRISSARQRLREVMRAHRRAGSFADSGLKDAPH